ncbi:xylulokinase [Tessaracoccus flavus]|uniref:Xylulose kinase n=1 Tax=Tessaracoccus flavus TaxID=1610493 RepID=A0A1Q2CIE7_9ACTN|nr:xylulokinase [Tessaracoccus flavus]AQP45906.1 xylulokinase [Tessaracoccus flavus]SDZ05959.1 xylulokinase [Tessaracoccus flavus]
MALVAGVDSSTQSCKVLVVDADSGEIVRQGSASHPAGTEVHPDAWWSAFQEAAAAAEGLDDVEALSVGGQQHGMVVLDADGEVIRPALLWNDTRSADAAAALRLEFDQWAEVTGSLPLASFTNTKLRWLADAEPEGAARVAAVALPHDWLTWKIRGHRDLGELVTDRSDASGTGYFDSYRNEYRPDLLSLALRRPADDVVLPRVLGPWESVEGPGFVVGPGCGDNAGAALGLGMSAGEVSVSLGTSGVVAAVSANPVVDPSGQVNVFADATGQWLPLTATLNAARILDAAREMLGVDHEELSRLALQAEPGAGGLTLVPWFEGERTPNLPGAKASLLGATLGNFTRENLARAAVEGLLALMATGVDGIAQLGVEVTRVKLIGGASKSRAVREIAPSVLGVPIDVPASAEYVALGAARQAASALHGGHVDWAPRGVESYEADPRPEVLARYRDLSDRLISGMGWA